MVLTLFLVWPVPAGCDTYFMFSSFGATWHDADKDWQGDSNMCWAAVAANILTWGGWQVLQFHNGELIFENFATHRANEGATLVMPRAGGLMGLIRARAESTSRAVAIIGAIFFPAPGPTIQKWTHCSNWSKILMLALLQYPGAVGGCPLLELPTMWCVNLYARQAIFIGFCRSLP